MTRLFFSGIGGAGMNPLAQMMRTWGHEVTGSDRGFDNGKNLALKERLLALGIAIVPQDGQGIVPGLERFVFSTAVEQDTPEVLAARALGLELVPRPKLLAEVVNQASPGIAVAGTSGKSTVTGMLAWILSQAGTPMSFLGGAGWTGSQGSSGFSAGPRGTTLVAEACESDGSLALYAPTIGLVHNISRDHGEVAEVLGQFTAFAAHSRTLVVNQACAQARTLASGHPQAIRYGFDAPAGEPPAVTGEVAPLELISAGPHRARGILVFRGEELFLDVPQPGRHNLENAAAAAVVARLQGVSAAGICQALACFPGVARRFEVIGTTDTGIRVVDDYAHNGEKIRAAILAAQAGCERLVAVFQPHGFGPARFLRAELTALLPGLLRDDDLFCYAEIYFAGGTVAKDISARDLAGDLPAALGCGYAATHQEVLSWVAQRALPGDTVLVMGARDPDLPRLARALHDLL